MEFNGQYKQLNTVIPVQLRQVYEHTILNLNLYHHIRAMNHHQSIHFSMDKSHHS